MSRIFLLVGIGGFIGSVARYYSQQFLARSIPSVLPYATLAVNILGCFLIGIIYGLSNRGNLLSPDWRIFLATGFCGGFTTFSAFSYESLSLMQDGEYLYLAIYVAASVLFGLTATFLGILLIKSL